MRDMSHEQQEAGHVARVLVGRYVYNVQLASRNRFGIEAAGMQTRCGLDGIEFESDHLVKRSG